MVASKANFISVSLNNEAYEPGNNYVQIHTRDFK
jgi:hypothetical protein